MQIIGPDNYISSLKNLGNNTERICKKAVYVAGGIVADEIRNGTKNLPNDKFKNLKESDKFSGVSDGQKKDLLNSFGISPIDRDRKGIINVKLGFEGYGSYPTKTYPKGVPNALLARSIESGSSVRQKIPFIRKAVMKTKKVALQEMEKSIESDMKIYAL